MSYFFMRNSLRQTVSVITLLALVSCGGGGGGGGGETPMDTTPTQNVPDPNFVPTYLFGSQAEYNAANYIDAMNIRVAHEAGFSGAGIVVAVVDSGINPNHVEFAGQIHAASRDIIEDSSALFDDNGHGTAMAGIIGAAGNGVGIIGIAPNAKLLILNAFDNGFYDPDVAEAIRYAVDNGARIVNMSLGGHYPNWDVLDRAVEYASENDVILLFATGNDGNYYAANYPARDVGKLRFGTTSLAVTALDENDVIADFANPCDVFDPTYCVAALGVNVYTTRHSGGYMYIDGTSPATAVVSGMMALLLEYFPELSADEAVEIMLLTTDDLGAPGVDKVYGSGKVNLERAMQPVGTMNVASVESENLPNESVVVMGGAFGDGMQAASALKSVSLYDGYQRHYFADFSGQVFAEKTDDKADEVSGFYQFQYVNDEKQIALTAYFDDVANAARDADKNQTHGAALGVSPFYEIADLDWQIGARKTYQDIDFVVSVAQNWNDESVTRLLNVAVDTDIAPALGLRLGASYLYEDNSMLGSRISGAFGDVKRADSYALQIGAHYQAEIAQVYANIAYSTSDIQFEEAGLLSGAKDVYGTAWEIGVIADDVLSARDRLSFSLRQDFRIENGSLLVDDDVALSEWIDIAPSGRELRAKAVYDYELNDAIAANVYVEAIRDENHVKKKDTDFAFGGALEFTF